MMVPSGDHRQGTRDGRGRGDRLASAVPDSLSGTGAQLVNQEPHRDAPAELTDRKNTQQYLAKRTV
jgi:hypothetical protein